jgi:hypothetical protein
MNMFHSVPGVPRGKMERFGGLPGSHGFQLTFIKLISLLTYCCQSTALLLKKSFHENN